MVKLGQFFSYIVACIWWIIPWRFNEFLGHCLAFLWIDVFQIRKKIILENLITALPYLKPNEAEALARKSMQSLCRSFFDVIKIPYLDSGWIQNNVVFEGLDKFAKVDSQNGVLFLTLHLGSGDLGAAVISESVIPCTLISKRFKNKFLDSFWFSLRGRSKTEFIDAHAKSNAFEILGALKKKRGVIFVLDQFMGKPYGIETEFFGVKTGTAYGLALFAKKTKHPVVPIYTYWNGSKLHVCFGDSIDLVNELSETNEVVTNKFNKVLEVIIRKHPEHWMWVHRRWKKFE